MMGINFVIVARARYTHLRMNKWFVSSAVDNDNHHEICYYDGQCECNDEERLKYVRHHQVIEEICRICIITAAISNWRGNERRHLFVHHIAAGADIDWE